MSSSPGEKFHSVLSIYGCRDGNSEKMRLQIDNPRRPKMFTPLVGDAMPECFVSSYDKSVTIDASKHRLAPPPEKQRDLLVIEEEKDHYLFRLQRICVSAAGVWIGLPGLETLMDEGGGWTSNPHSFRYYERKLRIDLSDHTILDISGYGNAAMPLIFDELDIHLSGGSILSFSGNGKTLCRSLQLTMDSTSSLWSLAVTETARIYCTNSDALPDGRFRGCALGMNVTLSGPASRHPLPRDLCHQDWVDKTYRQCMQAMGRRIRQVPQRPPAPSADQRMGMLEELFRPSASATPSEEEEEQHHDQPREGRFNTAVLLDDVFQLPTPPDGDVEAEQLEEEHNRAANIQQEQILEARQEGAKETRKRLLEEQEQEVSKVRKTTDEQEKPEINCSICLEPMTVRGVFGPCGHAKFCYPCARKSWIESGINCPTCGVKALCVSRLYL